MSLVEMQKVSLLALSDFKDEIIKILSDSEAIHITKIRDEAGPALKESPGQIEYKLSELKSTIDFLEHIEQRKKTFIESFVPNKEELTKEKLASTAQYFDYESPINKYKQIENKLSNLKNLLNELDAEYEKVFPWQRLPAPLQDLTCSLKTCLVSGIIKKKHFIEFKQNLNKLSNCVEINIAGQNKEELFIILIYLAEEKKPIEDYLVKSALKSVELPNSRRTAKEEIKHILKVKAETEAEIKELTAEAKEMVPELNNLKRVYDYFLEQKNQLKVKEQFFSGKHTFVLEGWIIKAQSLKLKTQIEKTTKEFEIFNIEPSAGEKPPVAIKNPTLASPFEMITKVYGTPKNEDIDPTLPLSFFFALFFGLCLGDFGYGLSLMLISFYFLKKYKLPQGGKDLFDLFIFGSAVSMVVGVLTGSYFGYTPGGILGKLQIVNPITNPLTMLVISLALGVIQILFGISLQMYNNIRKKQYLNAIFDDLFWMFFLGSLVFLIVSSALSLPTSKLASSLSIAGAILLVLTQGRSEKNIIKKFLGGVLSLYKVTSYMGDTLSYSRLLALGMSSAIIGSVINILAGMLKGSVPVLGIILMILLLIFGHAFNLIISTLSAFVHSMRLQMVEFFGKFYEGGGMEFKPFKRAAEYTVINNLKTGGN